MENPTHIFSWNLTCWLILSRYLGLSVFCLPPVGLRYSVNEKRIVLEFRCAEPQVLLRASTHMFKTCQRLSAVLFERKKRRDFNLLTIFRIETMQQYECKQKEKRKEVLTANADMMKVTWRLLVTILLGSSLKANKVERPWLSISTSTTTITY